MYEKSISYRNLAQKGSFPIENENFLSDFKILWEFCRILSKSKFIKEVLFSDMKFRISCRKIVFPMKKKIFSRRNLFFNGKYLMHYLTNALSYGTFVFFSYVHLRQVQTCHCGTGKCLTS